MRNNQKTYPGTRPALAMLLCSCIAFSAAATYVPPGGQEAVTAAAPAAQTATAAQTKPVKSQAEETKPPETESEEKIYEPAPYILNLAYQFPEGAESSCAEILMKELIQKDSQWYAGIYDMANTAPKKVAARLGRSSSSVLGKYNPTSKSQNADDPSTWSIEHFKNVRVSFYNGDGQVTSAVSNAQDIISMVSVYAYYNDITDIDQLRSYMNHLWSMSHSYGTSMGEVYYCDGCVNPDEGIQAEDDSELENEDTFQEGRTIDTEISITQSDEDEELTEPESELYGVLPSETASQVKTQTEITQTEITQTETSETPMAVISETASSEQTDSAELDQTEPEGAVSSQNESTETLPSQTVIEPDEYKPLIIRLDDETQSSRSAADTSSENPVDSSDDGISDEDISAGESTNSSETTETENVVTATSSEALDVTAHTPVSSPSAGSGKSSGNSSGKKKTGNSSDNKICPGHVDLKITAKIHTLSEKSNLYILDQKGNAVEEGSLWEGWTSRTKAFVRHINRQSWADDYGLNVTLPGTRAPLSTAEIESYMNQLPSDTTEERKDIIRFALQSVGKVPYYWGGKPSSKNYSGNSFGSVTIPDHRGRILRGLDCSGWINWVYWSVTENRLPYEGTEGLKSTGKQIGRQDLKPGDIIVITGSTPHVIMFMNWTADGQIQCVHETGSANNVTVGVMNANWPYYRNLLD